MTAGRGIVHSEMPGADDENVGLQLWVNLKSTDKVICTSHCIYMYVQYCIHSVRYLLCVTCVIQGWNYKLVVFEK